MILTEYGLRFTREPDGWRCVERPRLRMTRDGTHHLDGYTQVFASLHEAMQHLTDPAASLDIS